ncbi:MAG: hypothetical protein COT15_03120, partial [Candidatus Diapherotrites archaeon CG08_land_8_20_14_0_20_34_12]
MNKISIALAVSIFLFSNIAFAELQTELIAPFGGTIISKNLNNENILFSYSDSNESENLFLNFGYHYFDQEFLTNSIIQNADLKQFCQDEDSNSATLQNCSINFDSTQMISTSLFFDLQIINEKGSAELGTAEIVINNTYPKVIEFYPEGKTDNTLIKFTVQSADFDIDTEKIKVIVNDDIEMITWAEKCQNLGDGKTLHCEWLSELVEEGENTVYVESRDVKGNGSYASAKEWSFIFEKLQDKNPPKIKIDYPENNSVFAINKFEIKFSVSDDESGVDASALMLDGQLIALFEPNSETFELNAEDGDHNFTIMAYDNAQNYSELTVNFSIKKPEPEKQPVEFENEQENQPAGGESFPWLNRHNADNENIKQEIEVQQAGEPEAELEKEEVIAGKKLQKKEPDKIIEKPRNQIMQNQNDKNIAETNNDENKENECLLELLSPLPKQEIGFFDVTIRFKDSEKIYKSAKATLVENNKLLIKGIECYELENKIIETEDW